MTLPPEETVPDDIPLAKLIVQCTLCVVTRVVGAVVCRLRRRYRQEFLRKGNTMRVMLMACVLVFASGAAVRASENGLVAHYTFDEGAGTVIHDKTGRGNDGQIHGAEFIKGKAGNALRFDGVDDYVDFGPAPGLNFKNAVTVSVWIYPEGVPERPAFIVGNTLFGSLVDEH